MRGLRDAADRLTAGPVTIAYLGNSVTAQKDGYRPRLHARLIKHFGHQHKAANAGFGGVGSIGSVCTMDELVIRHLPSLCFIECMTGDMGVGLHIDTGPALEGMLRKLTGIGCAACFINLPRRKEDFGEDNPVFALYAQISEHYGTPSINLGPALTFEGPAYFRDAVHTTAAGSQRAADLIMDSLDLIFAASPSARPVAPLFARSYSAATIEAMNVTLLRNPGACIQGRFRLTYPFIEVGPDNEIFFHSDSRELLGLLIVVGPHSGATVINGEEYQLSDRWCYYDRLHAYVFEKPFSANTQVTISPLATARDVAAPPPRLKVIGFLVRPI